MKVNKDVLIQKIASRKFWALLAGLIGSILITFNLDGNSVAQITAIVGGFGSIFIYTLSEASVDKVRIENVIINKKEDE
ncbi:holin [Psychrobacillus phage Perkons]|nr:holin [Psychrobacillus phage Perkons]